MALTNTYSPEYNFFQHQNWALRFGIAEHIQTQMIITYLLVGELK